jgi:type IV pilus assembly protein PilM
MIRTPHSQLQPIGLDLGADSIKMLQLEVRASRPEPRERGGDAVASKPRQLTVVAAATASLPHAARSDPKTRTAQSAAALRRILAEHPFVGRAVVAALPRSMMHVRTVRLSSAPLFDAADQPQLDAVTRAEIASLFPFALPGAIVRYLYAGQVRQAGATAHELIVLAAPSAEVQAFVAELDAAGVEITSLDCQPNALFRSIERFGRRQVDGRDAQMLVDIGTRQTQVIVGRGRNLCFCKSIDVGGMHLLEAVAGKLGITVAEAKALRQRLVEESQEHPAEAPIPRRDRVRKAVADATRRLAEELGRELSMCLRYHAVTFRGRPPRRVRIVGGDADDPQLMSAFTAVLSLPVEPAQPLFNLDTTLMRPADLAGSASQWALAAGLAMRFTDGYFAAADGAPRPLEQPAKQTAQSPQSSPIPLVQFPEKAVA